MEHRLWPLFDLAVRTPRLELRYPTDAILGELAELATGEIHPPDVMPFSEPWTDVTPDERGRATLTYTWKARASWSPQSWECTMAVLVDGRVVGSQALAAHAFGSVRSVRSGSWLGLPYQGRGIGKEMRAAMLHLAFAGLGAVRCESGAFEDNAASIGVSRSLGYADNGDELHDRRGRPARIIRFVLTRAVWEERRRDDVVIDGLEPCLPMFGAQLS